MGRAQPDARRSSPRIIQGEPRAPAGGPTSPPATRAAISSRSRPICSISIKPRRRGRSPRRSGSTPMNDDPFAPVSGAGTRRIVNAKPKWISVVPVPADAPPPPAEHFKLGKPSATWTYPDATGAVLGYVLRFDNAEGKQFRPLTLWRPAAGGKLEWRWESWPPKRPLYGLQRLAERPSAPVVICEGEKAADAATRLLPGFVAVTSPNGSKSAGKADWSPLRGRAVTVWPDADAAGLEYARQVAKLATAAGALSVAIVSPPPDCQNRLGCRRCARRRLDGRNARRA